MSNWYVKVKTKVNESIPEPPQKQSNSLLFFQVGSFLTLPFSVSTYSSSTLEQYSMHPEYKYHVFFAKKIKKKKKKKKVLFFEIEISSYNYGNCSWNSKCFLHLLNGAWKERINSLNWLNCELGWMVVILQHL